MKKEKLSTTLLRNTDSLAPATWSKNRSQSIQSKPVDGRTSRFGVLTPHAKAPEVPKTAVRTNLFQTFKIISKFRINTVREDLRVFAVDDIFLPVKKPCRNLKLSWVLDDGNEAFEFVRVQFAGAGE